jgi:hypothetical protein
VFQQFFNLTVFATSVLVRFCRITPGIVPANQTLYKLEKQSGYELFRCPPLSVVLLLRRRQLPCRGAGAGSPRGQAWPTSGGCDRGSTTNIRSIRRGLACDWVSRLVTSGCSRSSRPPGLRPAHRLPCVVCVALGAVQERRHLKELQEPTTRSQQRRGKLKRLHKEGSKRARDRTAGRWRVRRASQRWSATTRRYWVR